MSVLHLTETKLSQSGKKGNFKADENGYYEVVLGALNCHNSVGEYYEAKNSVELFNSSSILNRRIRAGNLYSELGHPKKQPGMSMSDFITRARTIEETNVCGHISEVWLDEEYGKSLKDPMNPDMIVIMGKIRPAGPHSASLESDFSNPKTNVGLSIRALCDYREERGKPIKTLVEIITWDRVIEPGMYIANKWDTPSLESLSDTIITYDQLKKYSKEIQKSSVATEDEVISIENVIRYMENKSKKVHVPKLKQW